MKLILKGTQVTLTPEDAMCAASVASIQMIRKVASAQRNGDHGSKSKRTMRDRWADGVHGMMGEIALSHMAHLEWTPGGMSISSGDVARKIEVRATEHTDGHLLVYKTDADDSLFVLMLGHYPTFTLAGCIFAIDAKQPCWWRDADPACWWVPQSELEHLPTNN